MSKKMADEMKSLRYMRGDMNRCKERLDRLNSAMQSTSRPITGGGHGSGAGDRLGEQVADAVDMQRELFGRIVNYESRLRSAEEMIDELPPSHAEILKLRYIDSYGWLEVSQMVHKSMSRCYQIHDEAMAMLADVAARARGEIIGHSKIGGGY